MRHELDGKDVGFVAGEDGCVERELGIGGFGLIGVDIEVLVIGARRQKTS